MCGTLFASAIATASVASYWNGSACRINVSLLREESVSSIALGLFIVFIIYVMIWSIKNDHARSIGEQTGLIKMREQSNAAARSARRQNRGRPQTAKDRMKTDHKPYS